MAALLQAAKIKGIVYYHVATASKVSATVLERDLLVLIYVDIFPLGYG